MDLIRELEQHQLSKGLGKVHFLRHQEEIDAALRAGYSSRAIWELLHRRHQMPIAYRQFHRYVRQYLKPEPEVEAVSLLGETPAPDAFVAAAPPNPPVAPDGSGPRRHEPERTAIVRNVLALPDQRLSGIHRETTT